MVSDTFFFIQCGLDTPCSTKKKKKKRLILKLWNSCILFFFRLCVLFFCRVLLYVFIIVERFHITLFRSYFHRSRHTVYVRNFITKSLYSVKIGWSKINTAKLYTSISFSLKHPVFQKEYEFNNKFINIYAIFSHLILMIF